jgi:hypothetical protein
VVRHLIPLPDLLQSDRLQRHNFDLQMFSARDIVDCKLNMGSVRYRSRFRNESVALSACKN